MKNDGLYSSAVFNEDSFKRLVDEVEQKLAFTWTPKKRKI
jgi:hypothetical protein